MRRLLASALLGLTSLVTAVFKDEVGDIDFHYPLLGLPQAETTFFHRPRKDDRASLLYTLSDVGVLGAVNPSTGAIVWRQQITDEVASGGGHLRAPEGENWVAAAQGNRVQAWNALTGRNVWHAQFAGEVRDLEILELTESSRKDVLVLFEEDGATVLRRLHGALGSVVWEFRETTRDRALQVSTDLARVFVVSLHGAAPHGIKITSLEPATGGRIDHTVIDGRGDVRGPDDVKFVGGNSAAPFLAWASGDMARLHVQVIGARGQQELALPADAVSVDVHAPHLTSSQPHFLLHTRTKGGNKAEVYHTDLRTGRIAKAYELPLLPGLGAVSTSSDGANVYFTRITDDEVQVFSSESDALLARWALDSGSVALRAVSEVIQRAGGKDLAVRSAVVTTSDDWVLVRNGGVDWTRPEGLSGAVAATWAEVPEVEDLARALAEEAHTNPWNAYVHRVRRHMGDLKHLPAYLASLPTTILDSITGGVKGKPRGLSRDSFGFNKIMIIATRRGRVYALDGGNHGEILWAKTVFPQAPGAALVVRGLLAGEDVVTLRGSRGERAVIRVSDGEVVEAEAGGDVRVSSAAVIDAAAGKWLLALDEHGSPVGMSADRELGFTVVVREGDAVRGVKLSAEDGGAVGTEMWRMPLLPGQRIVDIVAPPGHDPIASIGRVLGDRTVLYKYLNPNAVLVAVAEDSSSTLSVRLVDGVSGQILVSQRHEGVDAGTVSCTMSENWFACSFFGQHTVDDGSARVIKAHQLVVSDMYESASANDRGGDGDAMAPLEQPGAVPLPHVVSQAWVVSEPLAALAVTQTRQGIANRQVLAYLPESHAVMGLARFVVDPRRPVGRDPTAAEMEAEGLVKYAPAMEVDARTFLTHERDVLGVRGIVATPTAVESTSLVLAFGVDVFGTRVAPSGTFDILDRGFNKATLLGTVVALGWGVVFLAPMVRRKQINRRWEAFL